MPVSWQDVILPTPHKKDDGWHGHGNQLNRSKVGTQPTLAGSGVRGRLSVLGWAAVYHHDTASWEMWRRAEAEPGWINWQVMRTGDRCAWLQLSLSCAHTHAHKNTLAHMNMHIYREEKGEDWQGRHINYCSKAGRYEMLFHPPVWMNI